MANAFEKELADIAYSYVNINVPEISDKIVGFEISDYDEKESKGTGSFLVNINRKYFSVPIYFIKGELKPIIILFDKSKDLIYHLSKEWIKYFESNSIPELGGGVDYVPQTDNSAFTDFRDLINPSNNTKYGSLKEKPTIVDFLKEANDGTKKDFLGLIKKSEIILNAFFKKYGKEIISSCKPKTKNITKKAEIRLIKRKEDAINLNPIQKLEFIKNGYVVIDERPKDSLEKPYKINFKKNLSSPTEDGTYSVLTNKGQSDVLIVKKPFRIQKDARAPRDLIVSIDDKTFTSEYSRNILVEDRSGNRESFLKKSKIIKAVNMKMNKTYMLVLQTNQEKNGNISEPFTVSQVFKTGNNKKNFKVNTIEYIDDPLINKSSIIVVRDDKLTTRKGNDLYIPNDSYAIELGERNLQVLNSTEIDNTIYSGVSMMKASGDKIMYDGKVVDMFLSESDGIKKIAERFNVSTKVAKDAIVDKEEVFIKKSYGPAVSTNNYKDLDIPTYREQTPETHTRVVGSNPQSTYLGGNSGRDEEKDVQENIENLVNLSENEDIKILDEGTIATLAKMRDPGPVLKSFIPGLMEGMDKLGRILIAVWYHGYSIKEDFGINEFSDFEMNVTDTFKNISEIILTIHNKDFSRRL